MRAFLLLMLGLVALLLLVVNAFGCGGEAPKEAAEDSFADLSLAELVDWQARPGEPGEVARVLVELERRVAAARLDEEALFVTVLPALEPKLAHEHASVRKQAVRVVAQVARQTELEPPVALVIEAVADEASEVRLVAVSELGALLTRRIATSEPVLHALARAVDDRDQQVRMEALTMLGAAGAHARGASGAVLARAQAGAEADISIEEQILAWETLAALKPSDSEILRAVEASAGGAEEERIALLATDVLAALTEIEATDFDVALEAIEALLAPLAHGSATVRLRAIEALEAAGAPARDLADEPLAELAANDPQREVRRRAQQAREALGLTDDE